MKILMCEPHHYQVVYEINPWMNKAVGVDVELAHQQWLHLRKTLENCGAEVVLVAHAKGWPDMVFTANAGLLLHNKIWLSRFRFPERQGESAYYAAWFRRCGYEIAEELASDFDKQKFMGPCFEGEGDALFAGEKLFAGFGFRSDKNYYQRLLSAGLAKIIYCELVDPYFYHLDTCFCPLNAHQALWWPAAFSPDSQQRMQQEMTLFAVPENEAHSFACNAVVLKKQVVIPANCPKTAEILQQLGFTVHACEMTEYIKAGGACKCLTLYLP